MSTAPGPNTEPIGSKGKGAFGGATGRKLVSQTQPAGSGNQDADRPPEDENHNDAKKKSKHAASMDELERMLEQDSIALLNMKKDLMAAQVVEMDKARRMLKQAKKDHDDIHTANSIKELHLREMESKIQLYENVQMAQKETTYSAESTHQHLVDQLADTLAKLEDENRSIKMQMHMNARLYEESTQCKIETTAVTFSLDQVRLAQS
jgi:hypothetical protein